MSLKTHKDLKVWQKAIDLVAIIYKITEAYPKSESYNLINQIQRSAVSIPSNIAEGAARDSNKEFKRFLSISLGSLSELETQLIISNKINYLTNEQYDEIDQKLMEIRKMLVGLKKTL